MCGKGPTDAVAGMDPEFVRQKGQSLASPICALRAGRRLPFFGLNRSWGGSGHKNGCYRERSRSFCHALRHLFHFFLSGTARMRHNALATPLKQVQAGWKKVSYVCKALKTRGMLEAQCALWKSR